MEKSDCTKKASLGKAQSINPYFSILVRNCNKLKKSWFFPRFFPLNHQKKKKKTQLQRGKLIVGCKNKTFMLKFTGLVFFFPQEMLQSSPAALPPVSNPPPGIVVPAATLPPGNLAMSTGSSSPSVPGRGGGGQLGIRGVLGGLGTPTCVFSPQVEPCTSPWQWWRRRARSSPKPSPLVPCRSPMPRWGLSTSFLGVPKTVHCSRQNPPLLQKFNPWSILNLSLARNVD